MIKKILFAGIAILFIAVIDIAGYLYLTKQQPALAAGNIINAASCSYADVSAAISSASVGDTVAVPAGSCAWTSNLTITKGINLVGAGKDLVTITNTTTNTITITLASDVPVRISGFKFDKGSNLNGTFTAIYINGKTDGSFGLTKIRIDNNIFNKGTRAVHAHGWMEGVIDHNSFVNCNICVGITGSGDDNYSWNRPIMAGTANSLFIEDNTFTINNNTDREPNQAIYHQEGGRSVTRYNTFDGTAYTNGGTFWYDSHGNWGAITSGTPDYRGQPILEVYNNVMKGDNSYEPIDFRGGSVLFYNNAMSLTKGIPKIKFREEESWASGGPFCPTCPVFTTWPSWDNLTNSFFWNNTSNGVIIDENNYATYLLLQGSTDAVFDQYNRDYFVHAPQATGGKSTYPTIAGKYDMTFSASGPNAYYPYTPYTYPHPLTITPPLKGDFNADSKVNDLDFAAFKNAFFNAFNSLFDLNSDGVIDVKDLGVLMSSWLP